MSVARHLSRAGIAVYALGSGHADPVRYSRHRRAYVRFQAGAEIQRRWLQWRERDAPALGGAALLPCNDEGLEPDVVGQVPLGVIGTVEEICEQLEERRARWGFNYVTVQGPAMEDFAPVVARLAGT